LRPDQANYPYRRGLFYAYRNPLNDGTKAFLGLALFEGKQAIGQTP